MPAINVARTDTFEQQRLKINEIGSQIFSITQGGSDLATGNLKIGDGTRTLPSLAFASDPSLGIYKPDASTIGYVSSGRKIADFSPSAFYSFRDLVIQKKTLSTSGISVVDYGENYDPGSYSNISLIGGTGEGAIADIVVTEFSGIVTQNGKNYIAGSYTNINLTGGNGSGATSSFTIDPISGTILDSGSGYIPGTYEDIPLTGGSGSGATANLTIVGTTTLTGSITNNGSGYAGGFFTAINLLNKPLQTFLVTTTSNPGTPPPDNVYQIDGSTQIVLNLVKGNTYRFDLTDPSNSGHPLFFETTGGDPLDSGSYRVINRGVSGSPGAYVDIVISPDAPTETINYDCSVHDGMGSTVNIIDGTPGFYGYGAVGSITVDGSGVIQNLSIDNPGSFYKENDILEIGEDYGGTGFEFTLGTPVYTGEIDNITITNNGSNYEINDLLSVNNSSIGGFGSGFEFSITSNPGQVSDFQFLSKGQGYQVSDILTLPQKITNISSSVLDNQAEIIFPPEISVASVIIGSILEKVSGTGDIDPSSTVIGVDIPNNSIQISTLPTSSGSLIFNLIPPYGDITASLDIFKYRIDFLGPVSSYTITNAGNGYSIGDSLSVNPIDLTQAIEYSVKSQQILEIDLVGTYPSSTFQVGDTLKLKDGSVVTFTQDTIPALSPTTISGISTTLDQFNQQITVSDTSGIVAGMLVTQTSGDGSLGTGITVSSVDNSTTITLSQLPISSGTAVLDFSTDESASYTGVISTTSGSGTGATFDVTRQSDGSISSIVVNTSGNFYSVSDTITISGLLVGGTSPSEDIILTVTDVSEESPLQIYEVRLSGSDISSIIIDYDMISSGDVLIPVSATTPEYTVNNVSDSKDRFFIDTGSGYEYLPNLTFFVNNSYRFDISDPSLLTHPFSLSRFRDGRYSPSLIENLSTVFDTQSSVITVSSTNNILPGMEVLVISGSGQLPAGTIVESVDSSTQLTLSNSPTTSGNTVVTVRGTEYLDGVVKTSNSLTIKITNTTPSTLYYYCSSTLNDTHFDEGGEDNVEATITIDENNPKVFGSGFELSTTSIDSDDVIYGNLSNGNLTAVKLISQEGEIDTLNSDLILVTSSITSPVITCSTINSSGNLLVNSPLVNFSGNVSIGSTVQIIQSTGNITTSGVLKTTNSLNINDRITITNNNIASSTGNNILLSPATGRVAKINTTSALTIPSGTTAQRPTGAIVENGSIRFNTDTGQYEGYSASTSSWSSLGGVRDLDGNTYITAEATIGANDNTLYFFNDGNNTVSVTPNYLQFVNVKKIRSINTTAPSYIEYTTNTQVTLGQYLKYRNNIYEVTLAGQTGTSGNEPTHTTGAALNGTAELTWSASAVAPLTFEEVEEVRIDPLGFTNLVVNNELRFSNNTISTDLNDLVIRPNSGKKVTVDAESSLVIPVGDNNQRGVAEQGSIRYNTDISQYEGYDGSNWTSLGGVKDVDGNTYIIPETAPGSNENILYFYNDGINTMRLSTNALDFTNIDSITSQSDNLDIETSTVTFNNLSATIDTSGTSTFISTTKENLDLGLAVGLNVDPLLRLDINGDIYLNKAFGTGSFDGIKLFNSDLSTLELSDFAISTDDIALIKGGTNSGASVLYDPTRDSGVKVTVSIVNQTTGDKEMIEYQVIDKGSDIYHTEIGNLNTGVNLVSSVFDFDANNNVRVTFTLTDLTVGDVVNITVVKHIFKK